MVWTLKYRYRVLEGEVKREIHLSHGNHMLCAWSKAVGFAVGTDLNKPEPVSTGFAVCRQGIDSVARWVGRLNFNHAGLLRGLPSHGVSSKTPASDGTRDGLKPRRYTERSPLKRTGKIESKERMRGRIPSTGNRSIRVPDHSTKGFSITTKGGFAWGLGPTRTMLLSSVTQNSISRWTSKS